MTNRRLIRELVAALCRPHVGFDRDEMAFVRKIRGGKRLTAEERERARRLFRERVDW